MKMHGTEPKSYNIGIDHRPSQEMNDVDHHLELINKAKEKKQEIKKILIIVNIIYTILIPMSIIAAIFSVMLGTNTNTETYIAIFSLLTLPFVLLFSMATPWFFFAFNMFKTTLFFLFLPIVNFVFILFFVIFP